MLARIWQKLKSLRSRYPKMSIEEFINTLWYSHAASDVQLFVVRKEIWECWLKYALIYPEEELTTRRLYKLLDVAYDIYSKYDMEPEE